MRCILIAITLVACTKPNPNLCCVDTSDCATVGLEEVKAAATRRSRPSIPTIDHDFDGDPRPSSGADVGADEL